MSNLNKEGCGADLTEVTEEGFNTDSEKIGCMRTLYRASVVARGGVGLGVAGFGHFVLEPLGVPHGSAETVGLAIAAGLFTPEMVSAMLGLAMQDTRDRIQSIFKSLK